MNLEDAINQLIEDEFLEQLAETELSCYEPMIYILVEHFKNEKYNE